MDENPHRINLHHNYQGMAENHPENVDKSSSNGWNKSVIISSSGCQTYESYTHEDHSSEDENQPLLL
jgi:hypothetical protein